MVLSDMAVRRAKATGKAYDLYDTLGLHLAVTDNGGKSWHFRYYWLNKRKRMSFGTYPEVSLLEARALRDQARALVAEGINPRVHRQQKRAAAKLDGANTFEAVYKQWFAHRELSLKKGRQCTSSVLPRVFAKDVLPALGKRSIYDIKRSDLLEVIARNHLHRRDPFRDVGLGIHRAQYAFDLAVMALAGVRMAHHQWVAQQILHWDQPVRKQRMPRGYSRDQGFSPDEMRLDVISDVRGLREAGIEGVVAEPAQLLGEGEEASQVAKFHPYVFSSFGQPRT